MTDTSNNSDSAERAAKPDTRVVAALGGFGGLGLAIGMHVGRSLAGSIGYWIGLGAGFAVGSLLGYVVLRLRKSSVSFHPTVSTFVAWGLIIGVASAIGQALAGTTGALIGFFTFPVLAVIYGFVRRPRPE